MKARNAKFSVLALALVLCMAIAGISAYFTDGDTATNEFELGEVSIDLQEEEFDEENAIDLVPQQEIAKDPNVVNTGVNDAYVFIEVIVPYANIRTANEDGTVNAAADTQLFTWDLDEKWVQVGQTKDDATNKTYTYVYAYGTADAMTAVAAGEETSDVFDFVRVANIVEAQGLENAEKEIVVNAYAIQTSNLNDADTTIDGVNNDGKVAAADVWAVVANSRVADISLDADLADGTSKTEDEATDIIE